MNRTITELITEMTKAICQLKALLSHERLRNGKVTEHALNLQSRIEVLHRQRDELEELL